MVLRRGDARHKDVPDPLEAGPKRITTIHAQRKFAQGSGMNTNSPVMSPIKEKEKSKLNGSAAEVSPSGSPSTSGSAIPAKRPRTEDFITFLCYRGTSALPPSLNCFNVPSKLEKTEREIVSPAGSSKQNASPSRQDEAKMKRMKQTKRVVLQSKSKVLDQRQRKTRINTIAQKGKVLKNRNVTPALSKERLKKTAAAVANSNRKLLKTRPAVPVARASHPAILKRLGASRARAGLRSGGQLPPGSDVGIKTDRKPRSETPQRNKHQLQSVKKNKNKVQTPVRMKVKRVNKAAVVTPLSHRLKRGLKGNGQHKSAPPKSLSLGSRPSRKTKEAATLYMEMITKDLRSPDDDEEDLTEFPPKSEDVEMGSSPVKTRTRSTNVESTPEAPPSQTKLMKKKSLQKDNKAGSHSPGVRRSSKLITGFSIAKGANKRTRRSNKDMVANESQVDDESNGNDTPKGSPSPARSGRRSAKNSQASTPTSIMKSKTSAANAKKSAIVKQNSTGRSNEEITQESGASSHSDEEGESSSSLPAPKKMKKGYEGAKTASPGNRRSGPQRKTVPEVHKRESKKVEKLKDTEQETSQDKTSKRATRSGGVADPQVKAPDKEITDKDANKKAAPLKGKSSAQYTKKALTSESDESSEDEDGSRKTVKKETTMRTRRSVKKESESELSEESNEESKTVVKKTTRRSRNSVKLQEIVPDTGEGEKSLKKRPTRSVKHTVEKSLESDDDGDSSQSPSRRTSGRPKRGSTVEAADKRTTRKSTQLDTTDITKKQENKSVKNTTRLKSDSDASLESEEEEEEERNADKSTQRRTRYSKPLDTHDSDGDKKVGDKPKRTRTTPSLTKPKSDESESEGTSVKKLRKTRKQIMSSKLDGSDESDKEVAVKPKRPVRQSSLKSENMDDSGTEEGVHKNLKKLKQPVKTESGGESDKDVLTRRPRQVSKAPKLSGAEDTEKQSGSLEKEPAPQPKGTGKKPLKSSEQEETAANESAGKAVTTKSIRASVKVTPDSVEPEMISEPEVVTKRSSRLSHQTALYNVEIKPVDTEVLPCNSNEIVSPKISANEIDKKDPKLPRKSTKLTSDESLTTDVLEMPELDPPAKRGGRGSKVASKEKSSEEQVSKDKKDIVSRQTKSATKQDKPEEEDSKDKISGLVARLKNLVSESFSGDKKNIETKLSDDGKQKEMTLPKKLVKKTEVKTDVKQGKSPTEAKIKVEKEVDAPAKRGRKPKKVEDIDFSESDKQIDENRARPRRTRRAAVKRESYSEFSEEDEEVDEDEVPLPRTRERKSNVRYTEKDTDESEESEVEKRPRRTRRAVTANAIAVELDSEEEFVELPSRTRRLRKPVEKDGKNDEVDEFGEDREAQAGESSKKSLPKLQTPGSKPLVEDKPKDVIEKKIMPEKKLKDDSRDPVPVNKTLDKILTDDGDVSDSSSKKSRTSRTTRRNSLGSKDVTISGVVDDTKASKPVDSPVLASKDVSVKNSNPPAVVAVKSPITELNTSDAVAKTSISSSNWKNQNLVNSVPVASAQVEAVPEARLEPKRVSRRLSKDKPEICNDAPLVPKMEQKSNERAAPAVGPIIEKNDDVLHSSVTESAALPSGFDLNAPNKGDYDNNDGLAILSDVAFSELQNRKNIMGRKLSSDSATSFSSDDVPLPVSKEKVLPKAKADLPTVREKTESDEELSDVGNEEIDDESSYDEYQKTGKQQKRKRRPRRSRKEPVRQQPQRPVRSRRAKLVTDSYVDSFSSDRSSTPEITPTKPTQKKRRKSEDKPSPTTTASPAASRIVTPVSSSPPTSAPVAVTTTPAGFDHRTLKESAAQVVRPVKELKPPVVPKEEIQKVVEPQRNIPVKKPPPKPAQVEPILTVPKPPPPTPQVLPKEIPSDVKNNNSVTLFSGVSGVQVTKPTNKIPSLHQPLPKDEVPPQVGHNFVNSIRTNNESPVKPSPYVPGRVPAVSSSQSPIAKSNLFNMKNPPDNGNMTTTENKPKPNVTLGDTWKNAFKNAKIPKTGQLSPAHHSSVGSPFIRKTFSSSPKPATKPEDSKPTAFVPTKLPGVQTFKTTAFQNFSKLGSQSPSRMPGSMSPSRPPVSGPSGDTKPHVYLSPSRAKNSPIKTEEKPDVKKQDGTPPKSLTLLQYEKRSNELISSLKVSQPVLLDGIPTYVPAFPSKLKEYSLEKAKSSPVKVQPPPPPSTDDTSKTEGGKHLNLPFAVEHAFRKRSPITVKKPVKLPVEKKAGPSITIPEIPTPVNVPSVSRDRPMTVAPPPSAESNRTTTNLELLSKKKVQMTNEEIKKWLDDNTSSGVEHKDCGIFENNQCECSYRTSGESMLNTSVGVTELSRKEDPKIDHGVVEPPVQLKELDSGAKFTAETISTCKVEDYKEKMLSKTPKAQTPEILKELVPPEVPKVKKPMNLVVDKSKRKSSMTEDEMCGFDFRFERTSNSPRESCSDMSSPTPRDDVSSSNEDKLDPSLSVLERKTIFLQRRQLAKRPPPSKSPCAFSAENESSVYAFEPDAPPPAINNPFRRRGSRHKSSEDDGPASSSIAVQVNLENVATGGVDSDQVLECSTQTEQVEHVDNDGQLFYFPLEGDNNPQEVIQGVQVKLQSTEGPEQKVIMKAKLVTKPSLNIPTPPTTRPLGDVGRSSQRPEQKVRPLASTSTATQSKPLVGTVQPTIREPQPGCSASYNSQGTTTTSDRPELANQSTQAVAVPQIIPSTTAQLPPQGDQPKVVETPAPPAVPKPPKSVPVTPAPRRSTHNEFPIPGTTPRMVDAPTFYPTEKEFQDPLEYIEQITPQAQSFGICRIVPPAAFKPECKVSDDMRFTAYNQYVHKMLYRWGPNVREMTAIKKYLATQSIALKQPPYIGGMEIDLPRLYQTVQSCGGLKEVIEKKRWAKVADMMKIPKAAQDRVTKLDDIYCKFLLPYDTLSHSERSKLLEEVDAEWTERERRIALEAERESKGEKEEKEETSESDEESDDGRDECITKGRTMPLSGFYRIARNTMAMWFKEPNPSAKEVENEYWRQVTSRKQHVCVNSGSIDSGTLGYGFPTSKSSSTSRHPWNLKVLTNNTGSILRSMGPLMGVTVPTLHVGMLFSACCWYRDPHGLPWIEYLHTGANKIWYAVPDLWNEELHGAMRTILPRYCQDKPIWLASDTAMVPPDLLVQQGVSLCRAVQEPGQFILVFPKAFTSTICTGYIVSESVYFAQPSWLTTASQIFKDIQESCEPPAFSLERLLFNIATDVRSSAEVLTQVLPMITALRDTELQHRKDLEDLGVVECERLAVSKGRKKSQEEPQEYECEICRGNLYLSLVTNTVEEANFCLLHSVETLTKDRSHVKNCKLMYSYDEEEMTEVLEKMKSRIETKLGKNQNKKTTGGSSKV